MESRNPFSDSKSSTSTGRQGPLSPFPLPHVSPSYSNSPGEGLKDNTKSVDYHQRCSSDSFFMEEQPSWLDDLLNEPDSQIVHRGHRRSASDTYAYIGATAKAFDTREEPNQKNVTSNSSIWAQNIVNFKGPNEVKLGIRRSLLEDKLKKKDSNAAVSGSAERHEREESCSQHISQGSTEVTSSSQAKPSVSKPDIKRAIQQSAHCSRIRKLQYIAQLERTFQVLQAMGSKMSAELEFVDHQNLILNMENRALKQRLDTLSQEQLIKQLEHEMLERELGRLQAMCRLQEQEKMRMHHQQQQNPKNRRTKSRDTSSCRGAG